jgi:hypothetical protein
VRAAAMAPSYGDIGAVLNVMFGEAVKSIDRFEV